MLKIDNIICRYGSVEALREVEMEVLDGEFVSLVGANGAGKSTLLKAISGLVPPVKGAIWFKGERIDRLRPSVIVRKGIAHCPEERKLWPLLTVKENLELGAFVRKDKKQIKKDINWVYEIFPVLHERRSQLCGTLSGGEQQMVAFGRALMLRPSLLVLDEPSLGLAPIIVERIVQVMVEIYKLGTTMLLVEQNAFLALKMANRAYVLESGRIVREGSGSELLNDPYVKDAYLGGSAKLREIQSRKV